jgi:outer membrane protein
MAEVRRVLQFYLGAGINGACVYVHDDSPYARPNCNKGGIGGVFKVGACFKPQETLFFELFSDYLYQEIRFDQTVQIGGVKIGAGAGLVF